MGWGTTTKAAQGTALVEPEAAEMREEAEAPRAVQEEIQTPREEPGETQGKEAQAKEDRAPGKQVTATPEALEPRGAQAGLVEPEPEGSLEALGLVGGATEEALAMEEAQARQGARVLGRTEAWVVGVLGEMAEVSIRESAGTGTWITERSATSKTLMGKRVQT